MKILVHRLLFPVLFIIGLHPLHAQDYVSQKEKIYIQTDHVIYSGNDVVFFKAYVVRAENNTPTAISNILNAELISPAGIIEEKSSFIIRDGYAEGSFVFKPNANGGMYKIRAYTNWMQNEKETMFFTKEILLQKLIAPRILMKLDFPEKGYGPGSKVRADFSIRSLSNEPVSNHTATFTVFIGGNSIEQGSFKTDAEGKAVISFTLPETLIVNDGLLAITVDKDSYTESISRSIPITLNKIDLQFMPEGGTLVQGLSSRVAFKAINEYGKAVDISGIIVDENGTRVTEFSSYHMGMGRFLFTPQAGHQYKAIILSPAGISGAYNLPAVSANGIVMQVNKADKEIKITVSGLQSINVKLRATQRNSIYYNETIRLRKGTTEIQLKEENFPLGIVQFTLYAENELPLAERLVFLNEDQVLNVALQFDKKIYQPREKVKLDIRTSGADGKPVPSNLSLSVVDDKLWTLADDKQDHILSWLLLGSELKGKVEEPQFYFKKDEVKAVPALDLLMMTQGYRYFDFIEYIVQEGKLKYLPDQDNIISGVVRNAEGKPLIAKLFLLHNIYGGKALQSMTDSAGNFFFSDLEPAAQYVLFAQSQNKAQRAEIVILQNGQGYNPQKTRALQLVAARPVNQDGVPVTPSIPVLNKPAFHQLTNTLQGYNRSMSEVVVTGYGTALRKSLTGSVAVVRNDALFLQPNMGMLLQGKVAGLRITQMPGSMYAPGIRIRGVSGLNKDNEPLYVVNGTIVENLNTITTYDVESITILKDGSATALYGNRGVNGVIIIETKKYRNERLKIKFANKYTWQSISFNTNTRTFTAVKKFYMPVYTSVETDVRNDFRETIYWNPVIQTDAEGKASVEFYNSDASTTFRAISEGIGYNGLPGRTENSYAVKNSLQADAKIPPYLTTGDKALIPLVIRNNSQVLKQVEINIEVPAQCITGKYTRNFALPADSSIEIRIPLEAIAALNDSIKIMVGTGSEKEKLVLPLTAVSKGFPVKRSFAGNKNSEHQFTIKNMVPGTLQTKLVLFTNLEGQLLNGIESMLREPHGCFEQTSSSTYPNILILKYLKETGKSNTAIERKALQYIKDGYSRLISFETKENGFEWFGRSPAHEALTAYGLMEFTDMRPYVKVDEKMMDRTIKFLLSRRDGNGGFKLQNRGYDAFASVPEKIAHLYIVYALTEAGITGIEPEYKSAVAKALKSNDAYQLALIALAADNRKDSSSYYQLITALKALGEQPGAETSVVNSRESSLRVETKALSALALMRRQEKDLGLVSGLISSILSEKTYYGYGSTQATVLALKAITAYGQLAGKQEMKGKIDFSLNNQACTAADSLNALLKTGENNFSIHYNQEGGGIPYSLDVEYSVFTPETDEKAELRLTTSLAGNETKTGEIVRMNIEVENLKNQLQPMAIAKIGIPAGLSLQPWQLKELTEKNKVAYYEIFDNYLVLYWMGFAEKEQKKISLDLKADIPGLYKAKAGTVYLYYTPEHKYWADGALIQIR